MSTRIKQLEAFLGAPLFHRSTRVQRLGDPTLNPQGGAMNRTLLVVEAVHCDAVRRFVENDPYVQAGSFEHVEIRSWDWGLGHPDARD